MAKPTSMNDARKRAQAAVAALKQRIAKQEGLPAPDAHAGEDADKTQPAAPVGRPQPHPAARAQRTQGRREGK